MRIFYQNFSLAPVSPFLFFLTQVHIRVGSDWYLWRSLKVKQLSLEPDLQNPLMGHLRGEIAIRVTARNLAGFGQCSELNISTPGMNLNKKSHLYFFNVVVL